MNLKDDFIESLKALRNLEKINKELDVEYFDMIIHLMKKKTGHEYKNILDAPCGKASMHDVLRKKGYSVFGVECRKAFAEKLLSKDSEHYFFTELQELNLGMKFDVILNLYTALGRYPDDSVILKNFYEHLNENGILIVETRHANKLDLGYKIKNVGDVVVVVQEELVDNNKVKFISRAYKKVNDDLYFLARVENEIRLYTLDELMMMISDVGFKIEYVFDDLSVIPVIGKNIKSDRVVIVAKK